MLIRSFLIRSQIHHNNITSRCQSSNSNWEVNQRPQDIIVHGNKYSCDEWTNITPKILSLSERKLHLNPKHPLGLIKQRVIDFMYSKYSNVRGNPLFSGNQQFNSVYVAIKNQIQNLLLFHLLEFHYFLGLRNTVKFR